MTPNNPTRCPACGSTNIWCTDSEKDNYDYCVCNNCGHTFNVLVTDDAGDTDDSD